MEMSADSVFFFILGYLIIGDQQASARKLCGNITLDEQIKTLLAIYNREEYPFVLDLTFSLDIHHISVQQSSSTVHLIADLRMTWKDSRLTWNSSFDDCELALLDSDLLWTPRANLLNAGLIKKPSTSDQQAKLTNEGLITWVKRYDVIVPISLELWDWPKDVQKCTFRFGSRFYTDSGATLHISDDKYNTLWEMGEWKLTSFEGKIIQIKDDMTKLFNASEFTVLLQRRCPAHLITTRTIFGAAIIELITVAMISPASRIPLCACVALSVTVWMVAALVRLTGTTTAPISLSLMAVLLILSSLLGLFGTIVQRIGRKSLPPPSAVRKVVTNIAALFNLIPEQTSEYGEGACAWVAAAKLLDYILLCVSFLVLFIIVLIYMLA